MGKTSLFLRFTDGSFNEAFLTTLGVDFKSKTITLSGAPPVKVKVRVVLHRKFIRKGEEGAGRTVQVTDLMR